MERWQLVSKLETHRRVVNTPRGVLLNFLEHRRVVNVGGAKTSGGMKTMPI